MVKGLTAGFGKGLQSKKSMFSLDESTVVKKGISRTYTSRRTAKFDDNNSGDEGGNRRETKYKDTGAISYRDTNGNETILQPNSRLIRYKDIFQNLLKTQSIITTYPISTMLMTYDSTRVICVSK